MTDIGYYDKNGLWIARPTKRFVLEMLYRRNMLPDGESVITVIATSDNFDEIWAVAHKLRPLMIGFCDSVKLLDSKKSLFWMIESEK